MLRKTISSYELGRWKWKTEYRERQRFDCRKIGRNPTMSDSVRLYLVEKFKIIKIIQQSGLGIDVVPDSLDLWGRSLIGFAMANPSKIRVFDPEWSESILSISWFFAVITLMNVAPLGEALRCLPACNVMLYIVGNNNVDIEVIVDKTIQYCYTHAGFDNFLKSVYCSKSESNRPTVANS